MRKRRDARQHTYALFPSFPIFILTEEPHDADPHRLLVTLSTTYLHYYLNNGPSPHTA